MDNSKINQTELDYSCDAGQAKVNIFNGRLFFENFDTSIGQKSFLLSVSHIYNSHLELPNNYDSYFGKNWKLNVEQYLYKENNIYHYIDSGGMNIEFSPISQTEYYDTSGIGLELVEYQTYIEVKDNIGNKMIFENNRLVKTISTENIAIEKKYVYIDDKISKIYDSRKPDSKLEFIYTDNLLTCINVVVKNALKYKMKYYYENNYLVKVTKEYNNVERLYMIYEYENGLLKFATYYKNRKSFKFKYSNNKITNVFIGSAKLNVVNDINSNIYVGDDVYVGEDEYLSNVNNHSIKYLDAMETFGKNVLKLNKIEYFDTYRIVTNEVGLKFIYFLNQNGFTSSIMECNVFKNIDGKVNIYTNDLRSLEKMKGEPMLNDNCGNNDECVNKQKSLLITTSTNITNDNYLENKFEDIQNYRYHKCKDYIYYVCSFWLKCIDNLSSNEVKLTINENNESRKSESIVSFDKTAINSWQEVRIPIKITNKNIDSIKLEFLDNSSARVKIADMRLYYSGTNEVMIGDQTKSTSLDNIKKLEYMENNSTQVKTLYIDDDVYLTEKDLQMTYLYIFKYCDYAHIPLNYIFFYNDCTKFMKVHTLSFVDSDDYAYRIKFSKDDFTDENSLSYSRPNFFMKSYSPDGDLYTYHITYYAKSYSIDNDLKKCLIQKTEANLFDDTPEATLHKESYTLTCADLKGKVLLEQDEYGVQQIYKYDIYGVMNKKILTSNSEDTDRLEEVITYDDDTEIVKDNVTKTKNYYNDYDNIVKTEFSGINEPQNKVLTHEYTYDLFNESVKEVKDNYGGTNYIKYDSYGRIKQLSPKLDNDSNYYGYKFKYNTLGDLTGFFTSHKDIDKLIDKCILSRNINRNVNGTSIETYYHRDNNHTDQVISTIDKYGRTIETKYDDKSVRFEFSELSESKGASNITKMIDELDGKTHTYTYNKDNNLVEYGYVDDENFFNSKKISNDKTINSFGKNSLEGQTFETEIKKDENKLISPRVSNINYAIKDMNDGGTIEYHYDNLGRINIVNSQLYNDWSSMRESNVSPYDVVKTINYIQNTNQIDDININFKYLNNEKINIYHKYGYDKKGNLTVKKVKTNKYSDEKEYNIIYGYNDASQLLSETFEYKDNSNTENNKIIQISYLYNKDGSINTINKNGGTIEYIYDNGKLVGVRDFGIRKNISYDNLGNTLNFGGNVYSYTRGNLLSTYTSGSLTTQYFYNGQGKKYKKILSNGTTVTYVYDNEKLISEKHSNGKEIVYIYDQTGVLGFVVSCYGGSIGYQDFYQLEKDLNGNVISLIYNNEEVAHYTYDAYGNCEVTNYSNLETANLNPFRWKGMYCELESNLYFIKNNTYSPELRQTLSMNYLDEIVDNALSIYSLYAYNIGVNNPVEVTYNEYTMYSGHNLTYEEPEKSKWRMFWDEFWDSWLGKYVAVELFMIALALTVTIASCTLAALLFTVGMVGATLIVGGIIAGKTSQNQGKGFWNGFGNYINENWAQTLAIEMATYIVTFGITQSLGLGTKCFIEGTLVLTSIGLVKIEDIKPNDEVWSYNEETKERELKKVKQVFRNKTNEWLHLKVLNEETQKEENITCTKNHRIYIKNKGWIEAKDILENDIVLMYNNIQGRVINKELQVLDHFETTYNFEVEDNHNYYVGEECILVHNECSRVDEFLNFKSEEDLFEHFTKHADEFDDLYKTVDAYLEGANYVIKNGIYVPEMNGYIKFFGSGTRTSKFAFVGLTRDKSYIVTFGIRSTQELARKTALIVI